MKKYTDFRSQQGAVLVISLVLLAVLTLAGVASMSGSSLELRSASNAQQYHTAFEEALAQIEFVVSQDTNNPMNYLVAIQDVDDQSTWPAAQVCDTSNGCLAGTNATATASMEFSGGCTTMPGFSLEAGRAPVMRTFDITVTAQNNTGTSRSIQVQGAQHPAAGC